MKSLLLLTTIVSLPVFAYCPVPWLSGNPAQDQQSQNAYQLCLQNEQFQRQQLEMQQQQLIVQQQQLQLQQSQQYRSQSGSGLIDFNIVKPYQQQR